jgi:hypothetical protein
LGYRTFAMKPAYIKLSDTAFPTEAFTRMAGEEYGGDKTPMDRIDQITAEQIATHKEMIETRLEKMASEVLFDAKLTIVDDDYPEAIVDFERDVNNSITVGNAWGTAGATPEDDIQQLSLQINKSSRGAKVTDLIMSGNTADKLKSNQGIRDLVNRDFNLSPGTTGFEFAKNRVDHDVTYIGRLAGKWDLWSYDGYFEDDTGQSVPFIPDDKVLFVANGGPNSGIMGHRYNGAILDLEAGLTPKEIFVKSQVSFDPSGVEVVTQTAPLIAMKRPNASGVLTTA